MCRLSLRGGRRSCNCFMHVADGCSWLATTQFDHRFPDAHHMGVHELTSLNNQELDKFGEHDPQPLQNRDCIRLGLLVTRIGLLCR